MCAIRFPFAPDIDHAMWDRCDELRYRRDYISSSTHLGWNAYPLGGSSNCRSAAASSARPDCAAQPGPAAVPEPDPLERAGPWRAFRTARGSGAVRARAAQLLPLAAFDMSRASRSSPQTTHEETTWPRPDALNIDLTRSAKFPIRRSSHRNNGSVRGRNFSPTRRSSPSTTTASARNAAACRW